jgi:transposase
MKLNSMTHSQKISTDTARGLWSNPLSEISSFERKKEVNLVFLYIPIKSKKNMIGVDLQTLNIAPRIGNDTKVSF